MPIKMPKYNVKLLSFRIPLRAFLLVASGIWFLAGCNSKPTLTGFDQESWRKDARSCGNIRPTLLTQLDQVSGALIGLSHTQVIGLLGKPEGKSMEKSGQREYYYYVEKGPQCQDKNQYTDANKLVIRFDILDRVNLVSYKK
jgi:outer membrane protein assembly factor BamE (lipoprotein component of BamABCDE complex)